MQAVREGGASRVAVARVLATGGEMQPAREMNPAERRGDGRTATVGEG